MAGKRIGTVVDPPLLNEGLGAQVRRMIGSAHLRHLDPFLLVDHYHIDPPHGFPTHPHRGFQAITYILSGTLLYDTNKGFGGALLSGDVQCTTMGRGLIHAQCAGQVNTEGLTIWMNQRNSTRLGDPASVEISSSQVPKVSFPGGLAEVLAGTFLGVQGPCLTFTPCQILILSLQANSQLQLESPADISSALYTIQGAVDIQGHTVSIHQIAVMENVGDVLHLHAQVDSRVLLLQAPRLDEHHVQHGPYVMGSRDEVLAAQVDFNHSQNGFEDAQTWHSRLDIQ